jgi:hypothetical protein
MIVPLGLLLLASVGNTSPHLEDAPPGLHVLSPSVLKPDSFGLIAQTTFEQQYPVLGTGVARGLPGDLEMRFDGLFHHVKFQAFGLTRTYDFDEYQGSMRWGTYQNLAHGGNVISAVGWSRFTERIRNLEQYAFVKRTYSWGSVTGGGIGPFGSRLLLVLRGLHEQETRHDVAAVTTSLELPEFSSFTPLGDVTMFLRNPGAWHRPWAAGVRSRVGAHWILLYASNTWGTTAPDSLYGEPHRLFYNLRASMLF